MHGIAYPSYAPRAYQALIIAELLYSFYTFIALLYIIIVNT